MGSEIWGRQYCLGSEIPRCQMCSFGGVKLRVSEITYPNNICLEFTEALDMDRKKYVQGYLIFLSPQILF